jgi:regulator of sirC expression with transglutaminase-like and TPR domain
MVAEKKAERKKHWLKSPVTIAVAAILIILAGIGTGVVLGRRAPKLSGASAAGITAARTPGTNAISPALQSLAKEVEREDAPIPRLLEFAHLALDQEQFVLAIPAYRRVLNRDPKNPEALTHMGLILYRANHTDRALAMIDDALRIDPKYAHAHWDRANILYATKKDLPGAAKSFETFLALIPQGQDADRARAMLAELRRSSAAAKPVKAVLPEADRK